MSLCVPDGVAGAGPGVEQGPGIAPHSFSVSGAGPEVPGVPGAVLLGLLPARCSQSCLSVPGLSACGHLE